MDMENLTELPITELLIQWKKGNTTAYNTLFELCYQQFKHEVRKQKLKRQEKTEHKSHLQLCIDSTTNLVNKTYLKLINPKDSKLDNREDVLKLISTVVYNILNDEYRNVKALKNTLPSETKEAEFDHNSGVLLHELQLINKLLEKEHPRCAEAINLHLFSGLNTKQLADLFNVSQRTMQNDLNFANAWYQKNLVA